MKRKIGTGMGASAAGGGGGIWDEAETGTGTGMETRRGSQDVNQDGIGDGIKSSSRDGNGFKKGTGMMR